MVNQTLAGLVQMLRVLYSLVPAARAVGKTFRATYRSSFDPALVRVFQMAVALVSSRHITSHHITSHHIRDDSLAARWPRHHQDDLA